MKNYIYISGVVSAFFFLGWIGAFLLGYPRHFYFLIAGISVFTLIFLPLLLKKRKTHRERMEEIINNYQSGEKKSPENTIQSNRPEGWNMNTSPFRSRKTGVSWGGGNIHAAEAKRGRRRSFRGS